MINTTIKRDFAIVKACVYDPCSMRYTYPIPEKEGSAYGAATCTLNGLTIKLRTAKITPKKVGQFVTVWKRNSQGVTQPYDSSDSFDLFVINVHQDHSFGQFIIPKAALVEHGVISHGTQQGKRGIRVYPPWDQVSNQQAQRTQQWQLNFFLPIYEHQANDLARAKRLYLIDNR